MNSNTNKFFLVRFVNYSWTQAQQTFFFISEETWKHFFIYLFIFFNLCGSLLALMYMHRFCLYVAPRDQFWARNHTD